jgi:membrane-associated phospholipid phosphatase
MKFFSASFTAIVLFLGTTDAAGSETIGTAGDVLRIAIPAVAAGMTLLKRDTDGAKQLLYSLVAAAAVTEGLKYTVREKSPKGEDHAFPSGHASIAFSGAAFIQKRYGWTAGLPSYLAASFVAYSRVETDEHRVRDVLAGAVIGIASGMIFTSPFENVTAAPIIGPSGRIGILIGGKF